MDAGAYDVTSTLDLVEGRHELSLATALAATPVGLIDHPSFFQGLTAHPTVFASGLLAVADLASTSYYRATPSRDPVITASGDRLRFESFSGDNGVYGRLDLLPDGIDAGEVGFGTTNVDVNGMLRKALASLTRSELLHLDVGAEALRVATIDETHVERKVDLPERWVRGLAEVGPTLRAVRHVARLEAAAARAFVAGLPAGGAGPTLRLGSVAGGLRAVPAPLAVVTLSGSARLGTLKRVLRGVSALDVFAHDDGYSAWVAHLPGARVTLLLSPAPFRGFSGEGQLLGELADGRGIGESSALRLVEHLGWEPSIDPAELALRIGMSREEVAAGLSVLASSGRVGYDLSDEVWFHRELPVQLDEVGRRNPRLTKAEELVAAGLVIPDPDSSRRWIVGEGDHRRWVTDAGRVLTCTCPWWSGNGGTRGPCSHALAVGLILRR